MATTIKLRRDTAANWTANNPVLALGEPGVETDTNKIKIGNGVNQWRQLIYVEYPLPVATNTVFGTVKPDGTTITVNNGVITAVGGGGSTGGGGTINSGSGSCLAFYPNAGTVLDDAQGLLWNSLTSVFTVNGTLNATNLSGTLNVSNLTGTLSSSLLPIATISAIGGVRVDGTTITINNGVISSILPVASSTILGGVRVDGTTITINNGVITAVGGSGGGGGSGTVNSGTQFRLAYYPSNGTILDDINGVTWSDSSTTLTVVGTVNATTLTGSYNASNLIGTVPSSVLPTASLSVLGGVRVDGTTITINNSIISAVPPVNITGNAGTVTNGVYTTGTYANPSWITTLDGSKIINGVVTTGTYADPSWITSLNGSKVLNAVLQTETYINPSWITSLAGSKLTGTVVATNGVVTNGTYADPSWITSLNGSKVLNAVLQTETYINPSWITSLAGSKLTGTVVATNGVVTNGTYADPSWITSLDYSKISNLPNVTNIASLRAIIPTANTVYEVSGYYSVGDGGGGEFYGVTGAAAGTYVENGGTVILPTGGNGSSAWLRNFDAATPISIKWFGAVGDGATHPLSSYYASIAAARAVYPFVNALTQEASWAAIQAAIIYAQSMSFDSATPSPSYVKGLRPTLFIPSGKYRTNSPLFFTGTPNNRGIGVNGEARPAYDTGSVISYYGADYNIRVQNGFISTSSLTVGTGSKTFIVNYNSSTNYAAAGDAIVLTNMSDASATMTGTITSYSGTTMVINVTSRTGSGTYTGWAVRQGFGSYQLIWESFGINLNQSCNGGLLLDDIQESIFNKIVVQGFEAISTPPSYTVLYGVKSAGSGIALSRFRDCAINQVNTGYDFKVGGIQQTTIDGAGVYAANICYNLGLVYNLAIMSTFNESFEYGVLLENTSTSVGAVTCFGLDILNNSWSIAEGDVNARSLKINDTTTSKAMDVRVNYYGNLHQCVTSPPEYILLNSNPSNGFTDIEANIYNNVFYQSSVSAIRSNDSRARVTQYGNSAQSAFGFAGNYLPILPLTSGQNYAMSGVYVLAQDTGTGASAPNNTRENIILSVPIPPNLLGKTGTIKITANWSVTNNANNKTCNIRFNGIAGTIMCQAIFSTGQSGGTFNTQITNNGVTNAQNSISWIFVRSSPSALVNYNAFSTVDTTALSTIDFTVQKAVSTDTVLVYQWFIEVYPT